MYNFAALENEIFYFTDCVNFPKKYIEFLEELDSNESSYPYVEKWKEWKASNDDLCYGQKKQINDLNSLSNDENLNKRILYIINAIKEPFLLCSINYLKAREMGSPTKIKNFAINKYFPGKEMGPHLDSYGNSIKKTFTMLIYLNDNYDGGEIEFTNHNIKIKPEEGSVIIFPTYSPYMHKSYPVESGNKYFCIAEFEIEEENNEY